MNKEQNQEAKLQQQMLMMEQAAKQQMSPEAIARYGNLKAGHPEKALHLTALIAQLAQQGQITSAITDEQLKELLMHMEPKKRETKIIRK